MDSSDHILCNNRAFLGWKYSRDNDLILQQRFQGTLPTSIRDIELESHLFKDTMNPKQVLCTPMINSRGGNYKVCKPDTVCSGYQCFKPVAMRDYLVIPCTENTFKNHVECDDSKYCTIRHQLFMNNTKRK